MLRVAFLWHMHQPFYKDLATGAYDLPWVRLHALKDYYGMARLARETEEARVTFNLVPCLVEQLEDYAAGRAEDRNLAISRKAADGLSSDEVDYMRRNFFRCHRPTLIDPHPRYRDLYHRLGWKASHPCKAVRLQDRDLRDLQVWANLAWSHRLLQEDDPVIAPLVEKDHDFTEDDKEALFARQQEIVADLLPAYRDLEDEGRCELSTSPYYHPILPLLVNMEDARMAEPAVRLPAHRGPYASDGRLQLERAVAHHAEVLGRKPRGLWPSEGSVSEACLDLVGEAGFAWMASDETVLANSLLLSFPDRTGGGSAGLYRPYRHGTDDDGPAVFFRDRGLSDLIGFKYYAMEPAQAVEDFVEKLLRIERDRPNEDSVVSVILDGENPWEPFPDGGVGFLAGVYRRIASEPNLELTTFSGYLETAAEAPRLPRLWAGSWINANYAIWIGGEEDNRAWDLLGRTRQALAEVDPDRRNGPAWNALHAAQGSDWFWWYGEDFASEEDAVFDHLFRQNLANVYRFLDRPVPDTVHEPIGGGRRVEYTLPTGFMSCTLDGRVTSYLEWSAAGKYVVGGMGSTMGRTQSRTLEEIRFGVSRDDLFLRFDTEGRASTVLAGRSLRVDLPDAQLALCWSAKDGARLSRLDGCGDMEPFAQWCVDAVVEAAVPFEALGAVPGETVRLAVEVYEGDLCMERHPAAGTITVPVPTEDFEIENWQV